MRLEQIVNNKRNKIIRSKIPLQKKNEEHKSGRKLKKAFYLLHIVC